MAGNAGVVADLVTREMSQVALEVAQASIELLKDDGLCLNIADLLRDDSLGCFLENEKTLLDNGNLLSLASELLALSHSDSLLRAREVIRAVEVIKVAEGRNSVPVVERRPVVSFGETRLGNGRSNNAGNYKRNSDKRGGDLGEHVE